MNHDVQRTIDSITAEFLRLHEAKEDLFWQIRMGLSKDGEALTQAELERSDFCSSSARLALVRSRTRLPGVSEEQKRILEAWTRLFEVNSVFDTGTDTLEWIHRAERDLRATIVKSGGYTDPESGHFVSGNSVLLSNLVKADPLETRRRAAWLGMRDIERTAFEHGLAEIYRLRNRLAREGGYPNFYAMRLAQTETMSIEELFGLFAKVERDTREAAKRTLASLARTNGVKVVEPWNYQFFQAGSLAQAENPYFNFSRALERWMRVFAGLGVDYRDATVRVDLLNRGGKHPNGFMHAPRVGWNEGDIRHHPLIGFTANGMPREMGSGRKALGTLLHEGGHAAHFANMQVPTPAMSHEYPPSSPVFMETYSMFMDNLLDDADWCHRFAHDTDGCPMPFGLVEQGCQMRQPYDVLFVRWMLAVSVAEWKVYTLPDEEITSGRMSEIARQTERQYLGIESHRPIFSISHTRDLGSTAYYHGYALAYLAVQQLRAYFLERDGHLVDNAHIGPDLSEYFWQYGNQRSLGECMEAFTGESLSADALVASISKTADEAVAEARTAIDQLQDIPSFDGNLNDLNLNLRVVHGAQEIVPAGTDLNESARLFAEWIQSDDWQANNSG